MEYPQFLEERRKMIARVIQAGFESLSFAGDAAGAEAVPAVAHRSQSATELAIAQLQPRSAEFLRELLADPLIAPERQRAEVLGYLAKLEGLAPYEPNLDLDLARQLGDRCLRLLQSVAAGTPEEVRLVQAAVSYFTIEDDLEADLASPQGFHDDQAVLTAIESALRGERGI